MALRNLNHLFLQHGVSNGIMLSRETYTRPLKIETNFDFFLILGIS